MLAHVVLLLGVVAATDVAPGLHEGAGVLHVASGPDASALGLVPAAAILQLCGSTLAFTQLLSSVAHLVKVT